MPKEEFCFVRSSFPFYWWFLHLRVLLLEEFLRFLWSWFFLGSLIAYERLTFNSLRLVWFWATEGPQWHLSFLISLDWVCFALGWPETTNHLAWWWTVFCRECCLPRDRYGNKLQLNKLKVYLIKFRKVYSLFFLGDTQHFKDFLKIDS